MVSKVNKSSDGEEKACCWYCIGVMKKSDVDAGLSKKCSVCGNLKQIKPKCAFKLVAKATGLPPEMFQPIPKKTFQNTDVNLMCTDCKEKCFFCNKAHVSKSKFITIYIYEM